MKLPSGKTELQLLDELDAFRRKHQDQHRHPSDWCMRVMEAIVADAMGFQSREHWTELLRETESSIYARDLQDPKKTGF